jgi:hypothetical protein
VILMKLLIHKGGGERRTEIVFGCVQLKDLSTLLVFHLPYENVWSKLQKKKRELKSVYSAVRNGP